MDPCSEASAATSRQARRAQTRREELANSVSHGLVLLAAVAALPLLISAAARRGDLGFLVGAWVFGAAAVLLYLASTVYHALPPGRAKQTFRLLDHAAIYLLIAGTYTPFTLGALDGAWGWTLFGVVWSLAALGLLVKALGRMGGGAVSTGFYLAMGWAALPAIEPLARALPLAAFLWLLAGGLAYTIGAAFYALDARLAYGHAAWHGLVGLGTTCHFAAILCAA